MELNRILTEQLDQQIYELVCDLNAPVTDDLSVEYMQDGEMVGEAIEVLMDRIKKYLIDNYDAEEVLSNDK